MWIFNPLGVPSLYAVILVLVVILTYAGSLACFRASRCGGYLCALGGFDENPRVPELRT
jgi:hypothetical protein